MLYPRIPYGKERVLQFPKLKIVAHPCCVNSTLWNQVIGLTLLISSLSSACIHIGLCSSAGKKDNNNKKDTLIIPEEQFPYTTRSDYCEGCQYVNCQVIYLSRP